MTLVLSDRDQELLAGAAGPAAQLAISILVRMAEVYAAPELMDISAAHIDSTIYIGEAGLEFAERLASLGARVAVPTTLNVSGLDEHHWQEWPVPADWASKAHRQMIAYQSMGTMPTWTCAPYQTAWRPAFGQQVAWGESNAIAFANSVLGARTERYPDLLDICCAIAGRVPAMGLHLVENRAGQLLLRLVDVPLPVQLDDSFYPVLGHLVGQLAGDSIPVIDGLRVLPSEDQLKALGAAAASSGAVALFHLVGVTPEAPSLSAAFQGHAPTKTADITMQALRTARQALTTAEGNRLDMVVLGSPHFSLDEFAQLARLVEGQRAYGDVRFLVTSSRGMVQLAQRAGYLQALEDFGGQVTVDTCILATPMLPADVKLLMTNSAKYAYYAPGMLETQVTFGSLEDCVRSAVEGRVVRDDSIWQEGLQGGGVTQGEGLVAERGQVSQDLAGKRARASEGRKGAGQERRAALNSVRREKVLPGQVVVAGHAAGEALVAGEPLSFWGGYDFRTGEIIDRRHALSGAVAAGRVLCVPFTRGSSTTTAVLLEAVRAGTAPAAIVTTGVDSFFALASVVADEMYGRAIPLVALWPEDFARLRTGDWIELDEAGTLQLSSLDLLADVDHDVDGGLA